MKLTLELNRNDFNPYDYNLFEKGMRQLKNCEVLFPAREYLDISNQVYIFIGKDKHYLKQHESKN